MTGSFSDVLSEPVSPQVEEELREILKRKMAGACGALVRVLRALEEEYGPEVMQVAEEAMGAGRKSRFADELQAPEEDLAEFCRRLEHGCCGSHEWEKVEDTPTRQGYRFTRCLWAEIFNELDAADIGWWWCAGDEPAVKAYNPALGFECTKRLMDGDEVCDHVFKVGDG